MDYGYDRAKVHDDAIQWKDVLVFKLRPGMNLL